MAEHTLEIESVASNAESNWKRFRAEERGSYNHGNFRGELDALTNRALPLAKLLDESEADRERLKARVDELVAALTGGEEIPDIDRLAWLETMIAEIDDGVFGRTGADVDRDATATMISEVRDLATACRAALTKAEAEAK